MNKYMSFNLCVCRHAGNPPPPPHPPTHTHTHTHTQKEMPAATPTPGLNPSRHLSIPLRASQSLSIPLLGFRCIVALIVNAFDIVNAL
jgi:hypothetical protein